MSKKIDSYTREELVDNLGRYDTALEFIEMIREDGEELKDTIKRFKTRLNE